MILGADFNMEPEKWDMVVSPWLDRLQAQLMAPTNLSHTCRAAEGHAGSLIDYFMVSSSVRPVISSCEVVLDTPWGPHYGVMLKISTDVNKVLVWDVSQPHRSKESFARKAEQAQLDEEEVNQATARRPAGLRVQD